MSVCGSVMDRQTLSGCTHLHRVQPRMMFWIFWGLVVICVSDSQCRKRYFQSLCDNISNGTQNCEKHKEMIRNGTHGKSPKEIREECKNMFKRENVTNARTCQKSTRVHPNPSVPVKILSRCVLEKKKLSSKKCDDDSKKDNGLLQSLCAVESFINLCKRGMYQNFVRDINEVKDVLEETDVSESTLLFGDSYSALLYKPGETLNETEFHSDKNMSVTYQRANTTVSVYLPESLDIGKEDKIIFSILQFPNGTVQNSTSELYGQRLVGLSVANKTISGLSDRVNLTMSFSLGQNQSAVKTLCVFLDDSGNLSSNGCLTLWDKNQSQVTCSCNHLTYFGVLLVSASLSSTDQQIMSYISEIGCGISLFFLVVTVFVFFTMRKIKVDDSKKIHISLAIALILLNLHFLPSEMAAASSSSGLCVYMALALHYSLLATFCWMGLEGFHLYLLIVKVFNIYINRYMLKISVVGWGVPAVIVLILLSINTEFYGRFAVVDSSNSTNSTICYITNENVKWVTTVGVFGLMFLFVMVVFLVTVRNLMTNCCQKEFKQKNWKGLKQNVCTVLVLITLLGITWGIIFFSFGQLTTPGLYVFSILNSLQGFFIFLYFVFSLRKTKDITTSPSEKPTTTSSLDILE